MASQDKSRIRNFGIFAHIDAGKTTISERILYYTGRTHKIGEVHDGAAVMDWMKQEQERGITITAATTRVEWKGYDLHLIDTPGHVDFTVEVERSLRVLDGVVLVLDAVAGVQPQTETIWRQTIGYGVPVISFINKMDRIGANFEAAVTSFSEKLKSRPVLLVHPLGAESAFDGVIDLISGETVRWVEGSLGAEVVKTPVDKDGEEKLAAGRENILEALADFDDAMAEAFLGGEWPGEETVKASLRKHTIAGDVVPVLAGTALRNKGVQMLLDAVVDYLPSPAEAPPVTGIHPSTGEKILRKPLDDEPFSALAFKIQQDQGRKLTYIRVYSGVFKGGRLFNATRDKVEKPAAILSVHADKKDRVEEARAGDILALTGLKFTVTGDTLCEAENPLLLETICFAAPVISMAVEPEKSSEEEKLTETLARIQEEDPTFKVETNPETGQTIISGMGELHLEVVLTRIRTEFNVGVHVGKPQVVSMESILNQAQGQGTFDRLIADKRHAAKATVMVEPRGRGEGNDTLVPETVTAEWPQYAALIKGALNESLAGGPLGSPVADVLITVLKIEGEEGQTSEMAVKVALAMAVREAFLAARPVPLEPIMEVEVVVPEENLGEVIGDINSRRGEIQAVDAMRHHTEVKAMVALRRMFGYSTDLRSLTQGRGTFTMKFARYDASSQ